MSDFIPDKPIQATNVPWFDEVEKDAGWQGQATGKSIETLKSEITIALSRLGGIVTSFAQGSFNPDNRLRQGFRINYNIEASNGQLHPGKIDIAALPVRQTTKRTNYRNITSLESRKNQSLKMALYMFRVALEGMWFMQQLSPGYAPLMPFIIVRGNETLTELWSKTSQFKELLPPKEEGEFVKSGGKVIDL